MFLWLLLIGFFKINVCVFILFDNGGHQMMSETRPMNQVVVIGGNDPSSRETAMGKGELFGFSFVKEI